MACFRNTVGKSNSCSLLTPHMSKSTFPSVLKIHIFLFSHHTLKYNFSACLWVLWGERLLPGGHSFPDAGTWQRCWVGAGRSLPERAVLRALIWLFVFLSCLFVVFNALTSLWLGEPICHSNGNLCLAIGLTAAQPWSTMIKLWKLCLCSLDQWNIQAFLLCVPECYIAMPWLTWQIFLDYKPCQ